MRASGPFALFAGVALVTLCAAACGGPGTDGVGSGGLLGSGGVDASGGSSSGGAPTGSGGTECDADPDERCSVPIEMCSGGFCEPVCVDYFYCLGGAAYWSECYGVWLYDCPNGCEENVASDGRRIYTTTEAEVCNPAPSGSGGLGGGGAGSSDG